MLLTEKELSFLSTYILCWHFFRITLVLKENPKWSLKMVPKSLCAIIISTAADAANSLYLSEKVTTISLVLLMLSLNWEVSPLNKLLSILGVERGSHWTWGENLSWQAVWSGVVCLKPDVEGAEVVGEKCWAAAGDGGRVHSVIHFKAWFFLHFLFQLAFQLGDPGPCLSLLSLAVICFIMSFHLWSLLFLKGSYIYWNRKIYTVNQFKQWNP